MKQLSENTINKLKQILTENQSMRSTETKYHETGHEHNYALHPNKNGEAPANARTFNMNEKEHDEAANYVKKQLGSDHKIANMDDHDPKYKDKNHMQNVMKIKKNAASHLADHLEKNGHKATTDDTHFIHNKIFDKIGRKEGGDGDSAYAMRDHMPDHVLHDE